MATVSVFTCPGANQTVSSDGAPGCTQGSGQWQQVTLQEPFDPSMLNSDELAGAFGAGFTVMGTGLVITAAARFILRAFHGESHE